MAQGDNMKILRAAHAFMIWREGVSVKWACTARELADAVGLSPKTVRHICRERRWPIEDGNRGGDNREYLATDTYMRRAG